MNGIGSAREVASSALALATLIASIAADCAVNVPVTGGQYLRLEIVAGGVSATGAIVAILALWLNKSVLSIASVFIAVGSTIYIVLDACFRWS